MDIQQLVNQSTSTIIFEYIYKKLFQILKEHKYYRSYYIYLKVVVKYYNYNIIQHKYFNNIHKSSFLLLSLLVILTF